MKIRLIAPSAVASLFFAACGQKSPQITGSSSPPAEAAEAAPDASASLSPLAGTAQTVDDAAVASAPSTDGSPTGQAAASSPGSPGSTNWPGFNSEAATQAATQYLDSYQAILNDVNVAPKPPPTNPQVALTDLKTTLQKLAADTAEFENRQRQVERQLTPEERERLLQYRKSLDQGGQIPNQNH
jgi:hypothetical protein